MANQEFVDILSPGVIDEVKQLISLLDIAVIKVNDVNRAAKVIKLPSQGNAVIKEAEGLSKSYSVIEEKVVKLNQTYQAATSKRLNDIEKERLAEIKLQQQREKAFDKYEENLRRQEAAQAKAAASAEASSGRERLSEIRLQQQREKAFDNFEKQNNAYNKLSQAQIKLFNSTAGLAAEMYLLKEAGQQNSEQYASLASQYDKNYTEFTKLDKALKDIDASLGRNNRHVGNYQRAFNGFDMSIQQIVRELPSAAVSLNTFFLAISNNLPMFFDEIMKVAGELKNLKTLAEAANQAVANQTSIQQGAAAAASEAEEALSSQVESLISTIGASQEHATAIREKIMALRQETITEGHATEATLADTRATLAAAGATVEQTVVLEESILASAAATTASIEHTATLEAQTVAATEANAALASQPGLLSRIKSSLFSVNTALTLGVVALTLWGGKIIDYIGSLIDFDDKLNDVIRSQQKLNRATNDAQKDFSKQDEALKSLQQTAKDETLTMDARMVAVGKLRQQYAYYYKDLTDAQILGKNLTKSEQELLKAMEARTQALAKQKEVDDIKAKIIDLQDEVNFRKRIENDRIKALEAERKAIVDNQIATGKLSDANKKRWDEINLEVNALYKAAGERKRFNNELAETSKYQEYLNETSTADLQKEANDLQKEAIKGQKEINDLNSKSILLDYSSTDAKEQQVEALKDVIASEYELNRTRLQNEADFQQKIVQDETNGFADREAAAKRYSDIMLQLAKMQADEQERLLRKTADEEIKLLRLRAKEGEISQRNANQVIYSIEQQFKNDRLKVWEDYSRQVIDVNEQAAKSLEGVYAKISEQERANKVLEQQVDNLRQIGLYYDQIGSSSGLKQFVDIQNKIRKINEDEADSQIAQLQAQKDAIGVEIVKIAAQGKSLENNQKLEELGGKQLELEKQITDQTVKRKKEVADLREQMKKSTRDVLQGYQNDFFSDLGLSSLSSLFDQVEYQIVNDLGKIETKTGSTFDKMIDQAGTLREKYAIAFNTITEVAQQAYAAINQNQQASFDAQYANLERQKDLSLKYAGDSEEGRAEIEKQYDEQRRRIKKEEAEQAKEAAIFNAFINTAQAVTAALPNIPLSILIAGLGAAQIALISAREIPAYKDGTAYHPGGYMKINDAPGSNYQELVQTPDGKSYIHEGRNVILNAPKGTKVLKAGTFNTELDEILAENEISFNDKVFRGAVGGLDGLTLNSTGITKGEMIEALQTTLGSMITANIKFDENGYSKSVKKRNSTTNILNKRVSFNKILSRK